MTHIKTALTKGMRDVFDAEYPDPELQGLKVSIEWPVDKQDYPSIWVDFEPSRDLQIAGINHIEYGNPGAGNARTPYRRWRFAGFAAFTIAALTSLERDRIFDAVVRDFAFTTDTGGGQLRKFVEGNEFIAFDVNWDEIGHAGMAATMGTPWGTDDTIYEITVRLGLQGEFISDDAAGSLLPLTAIETYMWNDQGTDPVPDGTWT